MNARFPRRSAWLAHSPLNRFGEITRRRRTMFAKFKTAALSALIGLGTLAAIPAQAEGLYLNYGGRHSGVGIGVQIGDYDRVDYRDHYRRDYRRGCTPYRALNKAERMGIRRARVVDVDRRTIEVAGRKWGERVRVTFARAPHCPVIRW
jgi:hypothetical protein